LIFQRLASILLVHYFTLSNDGRLCLPWRLLVSLRITPSGYVTCWVEVTISRSR